ncbi:MULTISPECIES: twin-arginine translocation signal domain-containing protein [Halolamina]|uniref:Tat (Twin-arginine translocation) pathway signal sequence n=1 Tax=Halolamina pelagica TaxID=699431 RepID=A0A1I5UMU4_9EURY|nr:MULTISPECIES: twin-arginine translocation signal domain-containing protein [Halolamina]NHX37610.1 twin-arginine translocation signal domain-containing protein [Halolamina sp. R1-12]SFP96509.1 Tat (twin-arginine translocation) pathway signal sequence [Halolamina pelagica]
MVTRRQFLGVAGTGVAAMGLWGPRAHKQYSNIKPSPTPIDNPQLPDTADRWPELGKWNLPGDPHCVLPTDEGRCFVGGKIEQGSNGTSYVAFRGTQADTVVHKFNTESSRIESITDLTLVGDSVIALQTIGDTGHRLIRLTRDAQIQSMTKTHWRETPLWDQQLFTRPADDELLLAGVPADSKWNEGLAVVQLTADGTPQWSRTYGNGVNPFNVRYSGQTLAANVQRHTDSGSPTALMVVRGNELLYHRRIPGRKIFDIRLVDDSDGDVVVVGKISDQNPEQGYIARLDKSGDPQWWRTLPEPDQSTTFMSIIESEEGYRIQTIATPESKGPDYSIEMAIDSSGEVQGFQSYPMTVFGGQFGENSVFVTESGDQPQLLQYRDMNRPDAGENE